MWNKTLQELSTHLHAGDITSVELTTLFLERIHTIDKKMNSFISVTQDYALAQAKQADMRLQKGEGGPLTGIPIAHKDNLCIEGMKTSCGSKMLDNFIAPYTATLVRNLEAAGCVTLGKLNMDEFAMGSSNETSFYGPVKNPWDLSCVPGGSSGGSAAAVAARLCPGATGSDTGGSIRQPASLCNLVGLKPTYGRVSRFGLIAFASSLDQAGPMTRTVEDAALLFSAMAGFDPKDSTSVEKPVPDYRQALEKPLSPLRIGLPKQFFNQDLNPAIATAIQNAIALFKTLGFHFQEVDLPHVSLSVPVYYVVASAECSSNLSRYDGVRFGYRTKNPKNLDALYKGSRTEAFGEEVKRRILVGTYTLSSGFYDAYYIKAQKVRQLIAKDFKEAFENVDLILSPTTPNTAFGLGTKADDPLAMYLQDIYTTAINLAGLPALSLPAGFIQEKPVGLQLIGPHFSEALLLHTGYHYQQHTDWHHQQPKDL